MAQVVKNWFGCNGYRRWRVGQFALTHLGPNYTAAREFHPNGWVLSMGVRHWRIV